MTNPRMKDIPRWKGRRHLNRPSNSLLIEALKSAKRQLLNCPVNAEWFGVCWFLPSDLAGAYLEEYISSTIGSGDWIMNWLKRNRPNYSRSYQSIRKARLMWIDWMIASLENKEYQP
jgi:hypothetical protein